MSCTHHVNTGVLNGYNSVEIIHSLLMKGVGGVWAGGPSPGICNAHKVPRAFEAAEAAVVAGEYQVYIVGRGTHWVCPQGCGIQLQAHAGAGCEAGGD